MLQLRKKRKTWKDNTQQKLTYKFKRGKNRIKKKGEKVLITKFFSLKRRRSSIVWIPMHDVSKGGAGILPALVPLNDRLQSMMIGEVVLSNTPWRVWGIRRAES